MGRSRVHSRAFKREACRQVVSGEKRAAHAALRAPGREHQLSEGLLLRWRHEYEARGETAFAPQGSSEGETLARKVAELERFCGQLALENAVFKKALNSFPTKRGTPWLPKRTPPTPCFRCVAYARCSG